MDGREFQEWKIYLSEEPLPDHWEIGAQIAHLIYSANRGKSSPKLDLDHFLPPPLRGKHKKKPVIGEKALRRALGGGNRTNRQDSDRDGRGRQGL